mmetsp:Transcript_3657/g.5803  ORF Transcript_3657/g.5803 Transcript_3657/m.5803 type:complete len:101 (+) Transcript_3657:382-684(+)
MQKKDIRPTMLIIMQHGEEGEGGEATRDKRRCRSFSLLIDDDDDNSYEPLRETSITHFVAHDWMLLPATATATIGCYCYCYCHCYCKSSFRVVSSSSRKY